MLVHAGILALRFPALYLYKRFGHCVFVGTITGLLRHNSLRYQNCRRFSSKSPVFNGVQKHRFPKKIWATTQNPEKFLEIFWKFSGNIFGNFLEISWKFSRKFPEMFQNDRFDNPHYRGNFGGLGIKARNSGCMELCNDGKESKHKGSKADSMNSKLLSASTGNNDPVHTKSLTLAWKKKSLGVAL